MHLRESSHLQQMRAVRPCVRCEHTPSALTEHFNPFTHSFMPQTFVEYLPGTGWVLEGRDTEKKTVNNSYFTT